MTDLKHDQGGFVKEIPRDRIYYLVDVYGIIYIYRVSQKKVDPFKFKLAITYIVLI